MSDYEESKIRFHNLITVNERDGFSNHRRLECWLNRLFRRRSKKRSKLRVTGLCEGNPPMAGGFPSQRQVTWKMFPFDDVVILILLYQQDYINQHWKLGMDK